MNKDINSKLCEAGGKKITLTSPQGKKLRQRMITEVAVIAREKNKCMRGKYYCTVLFISLLLAIYFLSVNVSN